MCRIRILKDAQSASPVCKSSLQVQSASPVRESSPQNHIKLSILPTQVSVPLPRRQLVQHSLPEKRKRCSSEDEVEREVLYYDTEINTELTWVAINEMENKLNEVTKQLECRLECNILKTMQHLRLNNIKDDNK